jgi:hypothetical protein
LTLWKPSAKLAHFLRVKEQLTVDDLHF